MSNGSPDYTRRSVLYAWNGTAFVPVLVDEAGNIVSVFKGDYFGTLKTVKLDNEGRIIALVTDELDIYGNKVIVGNAELAVRLGSEKFFDRRGDVFLIDNFKNGLAKWKLTGSGDGNSQILTADRARSGGYSVKLVGGLTTAYHARMCNYFPYPILSKWGFETHFLYGSAFNYMLFGIDKYTGTQLVTSAIKFDRLNSKLQYYDDEGEYQDIADFSIYEGDYLFNAVKVVLDLENNKYHRLIFNENTYPLSDYNMRITDPHYGRPRIEFYIQLYSRSGENDYIFVDNIIITQNEPD